MPLDDALAAIRRGWFVFPCHTPIFDATGAVRCSCTKGAACGSIGKHPRVPRGEKDATRDESQIRAWEARWPGTNWGLATGPSDLAVLDMDGPEGFAQLREVSGSDLPATLCATTGKGGHAYFNRRGQNIQSVQRKGEALGIRARTGYVLLPGSLHARGHRYAWIDPAAPIANVPAWVAGFAAGGSRIVTENQKEVMHHSERFVPATHNARPPSAERPAGVLYDGKTGLAILPRLADRALEGMGSEQEPYSPAAAARLASALAACDAACDGRTWAAWGRALFDLEWLVEDGAGGWTDVGLELWDAWSRTSRAQPGEGGAYKGRQDLEKRWASFERSAEADYSGPRVTVASIYAKAIANNWKDTASSARTTAVLPPVSGPFGGNATGDVFQKESKINGNHALPEALRGVAGDNPLIVLNQKHAVIADVGGKCLVMSWVQSKARRDLLVPSFQSFKSFQERYANKYITVKKEKSRANGTIEVVEEPAQLGAHWLKWGGRRSYEAIDLVPGAPAELPGNVLNLWTGFGVEPAAPGSQGSWGLLKAHILEVLAAGDPVAAEYIYKFAAWCVQRPDEPAEVAVVFRGGKGSGKGTFASAMCDLFGQHGLHIFSSKHLTGNFNAHLRNCILLFADEAFWAGDKQGESVLKGILTEKTLFIEQKGVDAVQWKNRLHVIMASNADWAVPMSHDERRYAVFNVSDHRVGDHAYFAAIRWEMDNGGLGAMLAELLAVDLGTWHPRNVPHLAAAQQQKEHSLNALHAWWESLLQDGHLPDVGLEIPAATLIQSAREFSYRPGEVNATSLGRFLRAQGWEKNKGRNRNSWTVPNLTEARKHWERRFGGWTWREELTDWQQYKPERS